jgi:hypothetical protein
VVQNDNTVRFGEHVVDIPALPARRTTYAQARVEVHERFDGVLAAYLNGQCLAKKVVAEPQQAYRTRRRRQISEQPPTPKSPPCPGSLRSAQAPG